MVQSEHRDGGPYTRQAAQGGGDVLTVHHHAQTGPTRTVNHARWIGNLRELRSDHRQP
jgi:hypothetical protein